MIQSNAIALAGITIRQDEYGRFCLNDLHQAAITEGFHRERVKPFNFLRLDTTKALVETLEEEAQQDFLIAQIRAIRIAPISKEPGRYGGTYVVRELVYAYAMWVSPKFHLEVIRTYDAVVNRQLAMPLAQAEKFWFRCRPHWQPIREFAMQGLPHREIAEQVGRSPASVGNCVRRMIQVGMIDPDRYFRARYRRRTADRLLTTRQYCLNWGVAKCS